MERRKYRAITEPTTPEGCSSEMEFLLVQLRRHQKNKDKIADPIYFKRVKMYFEMFDFEHRYPDDEEYDRILVETKAVAEKIVRNKPTTPQLYIVFFENILKVTPLAKVCEECGAHFHPAEITRTQCIYCM